jgi:hypothetical protein
MFNGQAPPGGGDPAPGSIPDEMMSNLHAPTLEFRVLAALMAVAVASVLWATFREFRRDSRAGSTGNTDS